MTERLHFHFSLSCIGEGNGKPLQYSCLENLRDGGAWWAAVYGVAQSQTWLKQLSSSSSLNKGFPSSASVPVNAGDVRTLGLIPGLERSLGVGNGNLHQCSCSENSIERRPWWATIHRTAKESATTEWLSTHTHKHTHTHTAWIKLNYHVAYFNRMVFSRVWHAWEIPSKNWKLNYFVCILEKCQVVFPWSTAK